MQLWDVDEGGPAHMAAGKFTAIIRKVADRVAFDQSAKLTFEVRDGIRPTELHRATTQPALVGDTIEVVLSPRPASCKPRAGWKNRKLPARRAAARAAVVSGAYRMQLARCHRRLPRGPRGCIVAARQWRLVRTGGDGHERRG